MRIPLIQVDAFAGRPFEGNPAAVCLLPAPRDEAWLQALAAEMNLSETAFPVARPDGAWDLRWFTPTVEVPLCGHATLASAHVLWETGRLEADQPAVFHTASGVLRVRRLEDGWLELDLPALPLETIPVPASAAALGVPIVAAGWRSDWLVLELASEQAVRDLRVETAVTAGLHPNAVAVTARASRPDVDVVSRVFAPNEGIPEDPVTGSAHCALACHWAPRLGRSAFVAYQASARGGTLRVRLAGDRALIAGQAVTVVRGELSA